MVRIFPHILLLLLVISISGCSLKGFKSTWLPIDDERPTYTGHYKTTASGKHQPVQKGDTLIEEFEQVGIASWYGKGKKFQGKQTANGDKFHNGHLTAAHKTLPIPSMVKVTNLENNYTVILMINDRGPYKKGRIIDVSQKAAETLGFKNKGLAKVKIEYLKNESHALLHKLSLKPTNGGKAQGEIKDPRCSINCHVRLTNLKAGIKIE